MEPLTLDNSINKFFEKLGAVSSLDKLKLVANFYKLSEALFILNDLNIFSLLPGPSVNEGLSSKELYELALGKGVQGDASGLEEMLNLMVSLDLVKKTSGKYGHNDLSEKYLKRESPHFLGSFLALESLQYQDSNRYTKIQQVAYGKEIPQDPNFVMMEAMDSGAKYASIHIHRLLKGQLQGKVLDVGCGPGSYTFQLCKLNTGLAGTLFDLPVHKNYLETKIRESQLGDRIQLYLSDSLDDMINQQENFDYLLVSRFLYQFSQAEISAYFLQFKQLLLKGGALIIHDFFLDEELVSGKVMSMNWMGRGLVPQYSSEKLIELLESFGFKFFNQKPLPEMNTKLLIFIIES